MNETAIHSVAPSVAPTTRASFYATCYHKISNKNQVAMPSHLMKVIQESGECELLLTRVEDEAFLRVFTKNQFDKKLDELKQHPDLSPDEKREMLAEMAGTAVPIAPDAQGRFVIPAQWVVDLGLKDEVAFVGVFTWIKICPAQDQRKVEEAHRAKPGPRTHSVKKLLDL